MLTAKQAAALLRKQISVAKANGLLPKSLVVSVRVTGSGYTPVLLVQINKWPGYIYTDAERCCTRGYREMPLSCDAVALTGYLRQLAHEHMVDNSHVEFDHFDRNFYVRVEFSPERKIAEAEEFEERAIAITEDPNSSLAQLLQYARIQPKRVAENPVLPLLVLEDPNIIRALPMNMREFLTHELQAAFDAAHAVPVRAVAA